SSAMSPPWTARPCQRSPRSASPASAPSAPAPETIAGLVRGQWAIESLHWLRDTLYREDDSAIRTRSGPRAMAALRNSQSAHYIRPGGMTPPKPPAGPVVTWNGHSPFSDSRHDLETAVAQDPADLHVVVPDLR